MKQFFGEFKKFITRGNVLDMAVGVIVGGAFTAIVNGLSNFVLKPLINFVLAIILGENSLSNMFTYLKWVEAKDANGVGLGTADLANSIYIDWGSLINAIINFLLIAFVLFSIVKIINRVKEKNEQVQDNIKKNKLTKEDKKILKQRGIKRFETDKIKVYLEEKDAIKKAEEEKAKKEAEEKAKKERLENPTVEDLLKDIRKLLQEKE